MEDFHNLVELSYSKLVIIPAGGCGEFGMNLTAYLHEGRLYLVDCGIMFSEPFRLGTDALFPDITPLVEAADGVTAYFMTHGHEDHIGALPHMYYRWPAPVYGAPWTLELLKMKYERMGLNPTDLQLSVVEAGDKVVGAGLTVEYIHVNHSIPMATTLLIETKQFKVVHTGDFKIDPESVHEAVANVGRLQEIGASGVDILLADSTNASRPGRCPSESIVLEPMKEVMAQTKGMVILSTFSSNLWRIQTIVEAARQTGRRVCFAGRGVETTVGTANAIGLWQAPESVVLGEEQASTWPKENLVVIATGCQGEYRAALARIANGDHRHFKVGEGDVVVLSSRMIPGNEKSVYHICDKLKRSGAAILDARDMPGLHVSGHGFQQDLQDMLDAVKPRFYVPVHGTFTHLSANQQLQSEQSLLPNSGDVLAYSQEDGLERVASIEFPIQYLDSESNQIIDPVDLRERLKIGELGEAIITGVYDTQSNKWIKKVEIDLRGVPTPRNRNPEDWLKSMQSDISKVVKKERPKRHEEEDLRETTRIQLRRSLSSVLNKKPVVISLIHLI